MVAQDRRAIDPAAHQPTKADLDEDVSIDATPDALAWAVTRGGAKRLSSGKVTKAGAAAKREQQD